MKYCIGTDIGGTHTVLGLIDEKGQVKQTRSFDTCCFGEDLEKYVEQICEYALLLIEDEKKKCSDVEILGVGIGAPNGNYFEGVIENAPNLPFKGRVALRTMLEQSFERKGIRLKVSLTNDANAAAMGEMIYGKAKGVEDFIMITLGTGVGSGIVSGGKLVYGSTGFAGEIGHTIVRQNGRKCNCGRRGCLERYCSATGFVLTAKELLEKNKNIGSLLGTKQYPIEGESIYKAALKGDKIALKCYDKTAKILALGLANAVAVTSPKKIFIFGGLSNSGELLLKPLRDYMEQYLYGVFRSSVEIELSGVPEANAAILGAGALCYEK